MAGGQKVQRGGIARTAKAAAKRHKRPCRAAPAIPTGVGIKFGKKHVRHQTMWRAGINWDPVNEDVNGRDIGINRYQVKLRATDASGEAVETHLQDEALRKNGKDFVVHAGSAPDHRHAKELNNATDVIRHTLTGLTTGIPVQVDFYARKLAADASTVKCEIYNSTDSVSVTDKNGSPEHTQKPRVIATRSFTPAAGKTYQARVTFVNGPGTCLFQQIQWHTKGDDVEWSEMVNGDDHFAAFPDLPRPASWYFQAKVRAESRHNGARCWSAWSAWTPAEIPVSGAIAGPDVPDGITLVIDKVEGKGKNPWRARVGWNEMGPWIPADGDSEDDVSRYDVQLGVSNNAGTGTANIRKRSVPADPTDTTSHANFFRIERGRHYRARVRAHDGQGNHGAWSAWTGWLAPGGSLSQPSNLRWNNPTPRVLVARWDRPSDKSDIDSYHVKVLRAPGSVLVDEGHTGGTRWEYHIPKADRNNNHKVRVKAIADVQSLDEDTGTFGWVDGISSSDLDSSDVANVELFDEEEVDVDAIAAAIPTDTLAPAAPTGVTVSQSLFMHPDGHNSVLGSVTWTNPTTNTDASPLLDHYKTEIERSLAGGDYMHIGSVDSADTSMPIGILPQGTTVQVRVRAVDTSGNRSAWATSSSTSLNTDTTVPGTPSTPTVTAPLSSLKIVWDGLVSGGGAQPTDYLITEIHVSTTTGFTPVTGTWVGTFRGKGTFTLNGLTPGTIYYVRLVTVDQVGNRSAASAQGSASATFAQLLGTEIVDSAITAAKIADNAVTTPKINPLAVTTEKLTVAGFSEQLIANGAMEELSQADATKPAGFAVNTVAGAGVSAWGTDTANEFAGDRCVSFTLAAAADAGRIYSTRAIPVTPGETYYVAAAVKNSRAAPNANRIEAWTNVDSTNVLNPAHASTTVTQILATQTGSTTYAVREGTITIPAGKTWMTVAVRSNAANDGSGYTTYVDSLVVRKLIGDALIVNLTASKITAGTLQADVLLSSKFYTDVSPNARVELDGTGFRAYDDTNKNTIDISGLTGKGTFEDITVGGESNFGLVDPVTGEGSAQITPEGNAAFQQVFAQDIYVGEGQSIAELLDALPKGMIAWSDKTFAANKTAGNGTDEISLYEISADLVAGRNYIFIIDPIPVLASPAGETGGFRVRATSDGSRPTTSSPVLGGKNAHVTDTSANVHIDLNQPFACTTTAKWRFLVTLFHSSPGASDFIRITSGAQLNIGISDEGITPPDTGIDPGAVEALTRTVDYPFDWARTYKNSDGTPHADGTGRGYVGMSGGVNYLWMLGFNATTLGQDSTPGPKSGLIGDLEGATINWVRLVLGNDFNNVGFAGPGDVYTHNLSNTSAPASITAGFDDGTPWTGRQLATDEGGPWVENQWVGADLPISVGQNFRDQTIKGIRVGPMDIDVFPSGRSEFFAPSHSTKYPKLRINFTNY